MISKLRFSLIAVILLVLLGFGFQNQANGQVGKDLQFCPDVNIPDGWLEVSDITTLDGLDFSAGLIGTVEAVNAGVFGGMDWMHVDFTSFDQPTPTNEDGAQIVTWWTQKNGRNTFVQLTNDFPDGTVVHVRILNEDCVEIRDFCDFYSGGDTHVYDFGDLVTNGGDTPGDANLQDHEGFLTITAVDDCPSPDQAIDHNALAATVQIISDIDEYGFNAYHRHAVCFDEEFFIDVNLVFNGSFQDGDLTDWFLRQGISDVIDADGINPPINPPPCQGPDCDAPDANTFQAYAASDASNISGFYLQNCSDSRYDCSDIATNQLINSGVETNVTVVESNVFLSVNDGLTSTSSEAFYDIRVLNQADANFDCFNYAAVCLVNVTTFLDPILVDCDCYNRNGEGFIVTQNDATSDCVAAGDNNETYTIGSLEFQGGASSVFNNGLGSIQTGNSYVLQFITGQEGGDLDCQDTDQPRGTNGSLVDNFRVVQTQTEFLVCDGILTGEFNAFLSRHLPEVLAGQFNTIVDDAAAADAVLINFADEYQPEYRTLAAFVSSEIGIFDEFEEFQSCGDAAYCFTRLGIDADLPVSEDFNTPTPIVSPTTPPPSTTPPTDGPTPTPSNNGSGGSCAIAGNPVQLGTAFANVLIPLVPVAFAFGVRAVRRRKK